MIVNKKLDRLKQWGRERMGSEVKTDSTDEFKALVVEMQLRQDGMERLNKATTAYIKSLSRRDAGEDKEKQLPVAYFGSVLNSHGDDFEPESDFGQCLSSLGRANERIARVQETYVANATASWVESVDRSLVQMKEYQSARKKLEARRLAFDTASAKVQKAKKEDFRIEEELRSQKAKYEESSEDVYRRMLDIKEAEQDSIADLTNFLDAELAYYDRCREILMQLKRDWPGQRNNERLTDDSPSGSRRNTRTASAAQRYVVDDDLSDHVSRPTISSRTVSTQNSPRREADLPIRTQRTMSGIPLDGHSREHSPAGIPRLSRVPTDPTHLIGARSQLRVTKRGPAGDLYEDDPSSSTEQVGDVGFKKAPPPPPPSRAKKPPPPPPVKRGVISSNDAARY
ncbi:BAR-domain-containing protein [Piedraia hortae CBS 480.64]|uniref:BAR-domain-containing protein n=1 Tax=Piedraia hortae CBS 480.64 TaxID=1314780 RepID=A0A6A7C2X5_9PEZI|nr:BAR-domain-containing protein [Piedraia hortae CBS 480.64]